MSVMYPVISNVFQCTNKVVFPKTIDVEYGIPLTFPVVPVLTAVALQCLLLHANIFLTNTTRRHHDYHQSLLDAGHNSVSRSL